MTKTLVIPAMSPTEGLVLGIQNLLENGVKTTTRNGEAWTYDGTVITEYTHPHLRVLSAPARDANPFFHIAEALWMLLGRNDIQFLSRFAKNMANYSVDGITQHAAYGYRWSNHFGFDQIEAIVNKLKSAPNTRQAVLQIWDADVDLVDSEENSRDRACNLSCVFTPRVSADGSTSLDMLVSNRSNDIVWGAYGANAVHFSFLHHLVAELSGFAVGVYRQVSDNYHMYSDKLYGPKLFNSLVNEERTGPQTGISFLKSSDSGLISCVNEYVVAGKGYYSNWFGSAGDLGHIRTMLGDLVDPNMTEYTRSLVSKSDSTATGVMTRIAHETSHGVAPMVVVMAVMLSVHDAYSQGHKERALRMLEAADQCLHGLSFISFEGSQPDDLPNSVVLQSSPCKLDWFHAAHTWIQRRI